MIPQIACLGPGSSRSCKPAPRTTPDGRGSVPAPRSLCGGSKGMYNTGTATLSRVPKVQVNRWKKENPP